MRRYAGPLELKPEQKLISGYFNVDNGSGEIRGVYLQGNPAVAPIFAQWIAPLKDLGVTTLTMRNTGGTDHLSFDAVGIFRDSSSSRMTWITRAVLITPTRTWWSGCNQPT